MEFLDLFKFVKEEDLKPRSEEEIYNDILDKFQFLSVKDLHRPRFDDVCRYYGTREDDPLSYQIYLEICKDKLDDEEKEYYENILNSLIEEKKRMQEQLKKEYEERKEQVKEQIQEVIRVDN